MRAWRWFTEDGWWFVIVVASLGILAPVPFAHAATRLRTPGAWVWPVGYAAAVVGLLVLAQREDPANLAGAGLIGLIVVALCHLVFLRRKARARAAPVDPAVATAMAARARRDEARRIVAQDPSLARELRIGRPDLARDFSDGGLVDLASAPGPVIAQVCGIEQVIADRIVETRDAQPLRAVDDVFAFSDIPYPLWDRIRERSIVLG